MTYKTVAQQTELPATVQLLEIDLTPCGGVEHFYWTNEASQDVSVDGQVYDRMPFSIDGLERVKGQAPTPTLSISNVTRFISPYLVQYKNCIGAIVKYKEIYASFIDGAAGADSTQVMQESTWVVRQAQASRTEVQFVLSTLLDDARKMFPAGQVLRTEFPGAGISVRR